MVDQGTGNLAHVTALKAAPVGNAIAAALRPVADKIGKSRSKDMIEHEDVGFRKHYPSSLSATLSAAVPGIVAVDPRVEPALFEAAARYQAVDRTPHDRHMLLAY